MNDFDVSEQYPGAIRQVFRRLNWPLQALATAQILNVFEIAGGIVTRFYLSIDPKSKRLFINQLYDDIISMYPLADLTDGKTFSFNATGVESVAGRVVVIGGPVDLNYYHWLFSWFSRLVLLEMLAPYIYNDPSVRFMIDVRARNEPYASFLKALGVDLGRVFWSDFNTTYRVEHMVLVSFLSQNSYYPGILDAVSKRLKQGVGWSSGPRRRVWISRQKLTAPKRRVANMEQIAPVLARYGFEEVFLEDLGLAEQIALFASAQSVAGVHGAGLANIIFCPADCKVLLVEKDFNVTVGLDRTFAALAQACGLHYDVMLVPSSPVAGVDYDQFQNLHHADVVVSPHALAKALERLTSGPETGQPAAALEGSSLDGDSQLRC